MKTMNLIRLGEGSVDDAMKGQEGEPRTHSAEEVVGDGPLRSEMVMPRASSDPSSQVSGVKAATTSGVDCSSATHGGKRKPDLGIDVAKAKAEGRGV